MTKVMIKDFGWIYLVVVLDWHSKKVVDHYAGLQAHAWHWLVALNRAVNRQFPHGVSDQGLNLMGDNVLYREAGGWHGQQVSDRQFELAT